VVRHFAVDFPNAPNLHCSDLRSYQLHVEELLRNPALPDHAESVPHVAITGMDVNLKLIAFHSGEES
jgi:hypothetical protein